LSEATEADRDRGMVRPKNVLVDSHGTAMKWLGLGGPVGGLQ
jgi:hypothetical protein